MKQDKLQDRTAFRNVELFAASTKNLLLLTARQSCQLDGDWLLVPIGADKNSSLREGLARVICARTAPNLILAHQHVTQPGPQIHDAILGNAGTSSHAVWLPDAEITERVLSPKCPEADVLLLIDDGHSVDRPDEGKIRNS